MGYIPNESPNKTNKRPQMIDTPISFEIVDGRKFGREV